MKRRSRYQQTRANDPNLLLMIGTGRSGTTLAKRYLAEHPALLMAEHGTDYRDLGRLAVAAQGRILVAKRSRYLDDIKAIDRLYGSGRWRHVQDAEQARLIRTYGKYDAAQRLMRNLGYNDERLGLSVAPLLGIQILATEAGRREPPQERCDKPDTLRSGA